MKEIFKSIGIFLYFIITQCLATIGLIFFKVWTDEDWIYAVDDCITTKGMLSTEYFSLVSEILFPALIIADILIIIPMLIAAYKRKDHIFRKIDNKEAFFIINLGIVLNFIVSFIVEQIPQSYSGTYNQLMGIITNQSFGIILLTSGILAPIIEELIFRYGICEIMKKKGDKIAIFVSALIFGIAHMNIIQSTYAFLLGLLLGYLYVNGRNLVRPMIFHLTVNTTSVLYEYASQPLQKAMLCIVAMSTIYTVLQLSKKYTTRISLKSDLCEEN